MVLPMVVLARAPGLRGQWLKKWWGHNFVRTGCPHVGMLLHLQIRLLQFTIYPPTPVFSWTEKNLRARALEMIKPEEEEKKLWTIPSFEPPSLFLQIIFDLKSWRSWWWGYMKVCLLKKPSWGLLASETCDRWNWARHEAHTYLSTPLIRGKNTNSITYPCQNTEKK